MMKTRFQLPPGQPRIDLNFAIIRADIRPVATKQFDKPPRLDYTKRLN